MDGLMMPGQNIHLGRAENGGEEAPLLDASGMAGRQPLRMAMGDGVAAEVREVNVQVPPERDVEHLEPATNAEERPVSASESRAGESHFEGIAFLRDVVNRFVLAALVMSRRNVAAAGKNETVHDVEQPFGILFPGGKNDRDPAGGAYGIDVARRQRIGLALSAARIGGDSDQRSLQFERTSIIRRNARKTADAVENCPAP